MKIRNMAVGSLAFWILSMQGAQADLSNGNKAGVYATATPDGVISIGERSSQGHGQFNFGLDARGNPSSIGVSGSRDGISGGVSVGVGGGINVNGGVSSGSTSVGGSIGVGPHGHQSVGGVLRWEF